MKPFLIGQAPDHRHDEIEKGGLVQQSPAIIDGIAEQVLEPGPALVQGIEDQLGAGRIGKIGRGQATISRRPSVSTAMWRLQPVTFLAASKPRGGAPGALTDWLSRIAALGLAARPSSSRSGMSARSWMVWNSRRRTKRRNHQ